MFKAFGLLFCVAVSSAALLAPGLNSASTNTAMNVMSSGSNVMQNDVQNVNSMRGGYAYGGGYAPLHPGIYPAYNYGLEPFYGHPAPFNPAPILPYGYPGYGGFRNVHSASSNTGANIQSTDSNVYQSHIQNVDNMRY